jgi:4a-hydroxytetrahydrobiopterin dehydratase
VAEGTREAMSTETRMARLSDEEIEQRLAGLEGWSRSGEAIEKTYEGDDFMWSVGLVNRLAPAAEEMNHHPDLVISWNRVTVTISTHSEGGLTENDFVLAGKIDGVA